MGGNYDGQVGSTGAVEVAETLAAAGVTLRHPLEILIFENEEGGTIGTKIFVIEISALSILLSTK